MLGFKSVKYDEFLDTSGVSISCCLKSPVFREDDNDGSFIFNTTVPATDKNKKLCMFPLRVEAFKVMTTDQEIEIYFKGLKLWDGTMIAKFARPGEIEIQIGVGRGEMNYLAKDKKISELIPDDIHTVGHVEQVTDPASGIVHDLAIVDGFDDIPNKVYPEVNYAVPPIKVEDLCSSMGNAFNNEYFNASSNINVWDLALQRFMHPLLTGNSYLLINNVTDDSTGAHIHHITYLLPYNIFVPLPYNSWVLKNVFSALGYTISNNIFEKDPDLKRMILYNIQTINKLKNTNETFYGEELNDQGETVPFQTNRYLYALEPNTSFNLADHVPDIDVLTYLRSLENLLFFRFFINNKTREVNIKFLKDIILSTEYYDISQKVIEISERKMDFDKIAKLIQVFDSNDGNGGFIKTQEDIDGFIRNPDVWYQGDLPKNTFGQYENKITYAQMQKKWFVCSSFADDFNHSSTWDFYAFEHYCEKKLLEDGKEWITEASAPACSHFVDFKPGTTFVKYAWHLPCTKQPLKFYNAYKTNENTCGLRFLFYRGLQNGKIQNFVPDTLATISMSIIFSAINFLAENSDIDQLDAAHICWYIAEGTHTVQEAQNFLLSFYSLNNDISSEVIIKFFAYFVYTYNSVKQTGETTKQYPLATNDVYDAELIKIPDANLSLKWDGPYGIYEQKAKEFLYWRNNIAKPVTIKFQPTAEDMFMDFSQWIRVNGKDFMIDEIRVEIKDEEISIAEADAWSR